MRAIDKAIVVNGLKLHYLDWNGAASGTTIVLLHGFMGHAHVWDDLALALASRQRVLALDQRGHGDSDWSDGAHYSIEQHFADLCVFIDALKIEKLILLGHSMGGRNALFYAACRPENVERLILVDTRLESSPEAKTALENQMKSLPLRTKQIRDVENALRSLYPYLPRRTCEHLAKHGYRRDRAGWLVPKYDLRMSRQLKATGDTTPDPDFRQMMNNIACPTLYIKGKESSFVSEKEFHGLHKAINSVDLQVIPRSSHMPAQENPGPFKKAVLAFLGAK